MSSCLTRDEARAIWAASGLTYGILTYRNLQTLRSEINKSMISSELIQNTFRAHQRFKTVHSYEGSVTMLRCRAYYFEDREAITFNPDGFIGFCGWADPTNMQPILRAFVRWVNGLKEEGAA